ncbi:MAG: esterase/lipase family protein, partial [Methanocella sp.]
MTHCPGPEVPKHIPVLLVHGIFDTSRTMEGLYRSLRRFGWTGVQAMDLVPNDASAPLEDLARELGERAEEICRAEKADRLDIVGFSMGGLVARYYVKFLGGRERVERLVTISSPHHGTQLAHLSPGPGAREMRPGSAFLKKLNAGEEAPEPVRYTSIWTPLDLMIVPPESSRL